MKNDIKAGFCVFLLALPLCLGIATVSGCPPTAGIIAAIIGGIVGALLGGAELSIKGPAAGLVVIILGAVTQLGDGDMFLGYKRALAAAVVAGVVQVIIALRKKAVWAEVIPPFVLHGMLAAIGVIIIANQSYSLMGLPGIKAKPLELLARLPGYLSEINPIIFAMGALSLMIVVVWPRFKKLAKIPSSVVVLLITISISYFCNLNALGSSFFVNLPNELVKAIQFPDFSVIFTPLSLKYIVLLSLVGAIESLLTVCAIDSIKTGAKPTDLNRDLFSLGIANVVSPLLGGLPVISEIVRSKANVDYGAESAKANFFHGLFMLLAIAFFSSVINFIPLTALAALLIYVGIRLASPKEFIHAYQVGLDQFAVFLTTFFLTLTVDLLVGVLAGIGLKFAIHLARGNSVKTLFNPVITTNVLKDSIRIEIEGPLTFLNYLKLKKCVAMATAKSQPIIVSLCMVTYMDHTAMKKIMTLPSEFPAVNITIEENQQLIPFFNHKLAARRIAASS